ncbi:MAG: efflux RND transporter periplasmic adaptor subunit [Candidatus Marinimicrobia bacterium]|nr:efflux RND transporter periplasmic adaptor subunit [Candidatus Neomarinimicrobiota bacterium]
MLRKYSLYLLTTTLIILSVLSGCGNKNKVTKTETEVAVPVQVSTVTRGSVESKIDFLGNISGSQDVKVYSTIPTCIVTMKVDVGDVVKKGQVLAVVDNEKIRQMVIQAEAGMESARAQYKNVETEWNRINKLYQANAVSRAQFDGVAAQREAAKSAVKQLEAALTNAKSQVEDSYIKAPIAGVVSERFLEQGDQTSPQMPVFTIVKMNPVKVEIEVVESQIGLVKIGQMAHVKVESYPDQKFEGKVSKIDPTLNPMSRTIGVEILIDNSAMKLKPGMFARVEIVIDRHDDTILIPKYAVLENTTLEYLGGELTNAKVKIEKYIYIVQDSIALKKPIQTGFEDGPKIEVLYGINAGERLVTVGQHNLFDSSKVDIVTNGSGL